MENELNAKEAYQKAQAYIDMLAPQENLFYHGWECHRYFIFDFLPRQLDPIHLPQEKNSHVLASKDGYRAFSYGEYGPVLVEKEGGHCSIHLLSDPKGMEHYETLIGHGIFLSSLTAEILPN